MRGRGYVVGIGRGIWFLVFEGEGRAWIEWCRGGGGGALGVVVSFNEIEVEGWRERDERIG